MNFACLDFNDQKTPHDFYFSEISVLCLQESEIGVDVPLLPDDSAELFIADMLKVNCCESQWRRNNIILRGAHVKLVVNDCSIRVFNCSIEVYLLVCCDFKRD